VTVEWKKSCAKGENCHTNMNYKVIKLKVIKVRICIWNWYIEGGIISNRKLGCYGEYQINSAQIARHGGRKKRL